MAEQVPLSSDASALQPALDAARNDQTHEVLPISPTGALASPTSSSMG
jgi:hypothetical protein